MSAAPFGPDVVTNEHTKGWFDRRWGRLRHVATHFIKRKYRQATRAIDKLRWRALFEHYETLGDSCEFSGVQRRYGVEMPALFNWRSTTPAMLVNAIAANLEGIDSWGNLEIRIQSSADPHAPHEYMVHNRLYGTTSHTFVRVGDVEPDQVLKREHRRLVMLRRKFLEDLAAGRRIYVLRTLKPVETGEVQALADLLRRKGDNTLLWVQRAESAEEVGRVGWLGPGLLGAAIDRLTPYEDALNIQSRK